MRTYDNILNDTRLINYFILLNMKSLPLTNVSKVGEFLLRLDENPNKIKINYLNNISNKVLTDSSGRVYIILSNDEIMKIGGSMSKGGIKATMNFYVSAQQGGPSQRSFCIHLLIEREINNGKKVELGLIQNEKTTAEIKGLNSKKIVDVAAFKESEDLCKEEYKNIYGKYPPWNFQENNEEYPEELTTLHRKYMEERSNKD
tara:strand:- start:779 stop:1384 length:606 start_codon:yes stop_codon:yes gene_type:complete